MTHQPTNQPPAVESVPAPAARPDASDGCPRCKGSGIDPEHASTESYGDVARQIPEPCSACQFPSPTAEETLSGAEFQRFIRAAATAPVAELPEQHRITPAPAESARALLWRHGVPEDIIDGALVLHTQELVGAAPDGLSDLDVDLLRARIAEVLHDEDTNWGYRHCFASVYESDRETDAFVDAVLPLVRAISIQARRDGRRLVQGCYEAQAAETRRLQQRVAELEADAERFKADCLGACQTIAAMHAAATGRTGEGPVRGVIEDVADVRTELEDARARVAELEAELGGRDTEARERWIQKQLNETGLRSMDFRNGMSMDIEPAREMVAQWVGAARAMLGDAPNYSETPVEMVVKVGESPERFAFTLQRVGKLTPHQARQQAEERAERAEARVAELETQADTARRTAITDAADVLTAEAQRLSTLADEEMRSDLEDCAQEWHQAAAKVCGLGAGDRTAEPADPADTCRTVDVDGTPVLVHGAGEMDNTARQAFAEVIRAAKRKYETEHPDATA